MLGSFLVLAWRLSKWVKKEGGRHDAHSYKLNPDKAISLASCMAAFPQRGLMLQAVSMFANPCR